MQWISVRQENYILIWSFLLMLLACGQNSSQMEENTVLTEVKVSLKDTIARQILDHQDRLQPGPIFPYFNHRDPTYRYLAAGAFASLKDEAAIDSLLLLLEDPVREVRKSAAFALGQIGDIRAEDALITAFQDQDSSIDANNELNCIILESIGKCGSQTSLSLLSQVTTYQPSDHYLLLGQARAIFRYMIRGIINEHGTQRMVTLLTDPDLPDDIRILACHYLARADINLNDYSEVLTLTFTNLDSSDLKNNMPLVLAKCQTREANDLLNQCLRGPQDFRLKCNALRSMARTNFGIFRNSIQRALYDKNLSVAITAAEMILQYGSPGQWRTYMNLSLGDFPWQVKITLLHAVSRYIQGNNAMFSNMNYDFLRQRINTTANVYEKAAGILALAEEPGRFSYIISLKENNDHPVIKTACIQALKNIATAPSFRRLGSVSQKAVIDHLVQSIESGDAGMVEQASAILSMDLTSYGYDRKTIIERAKDQLQIPRDMEALIALQQKLAEIDGRAYDHREDLSFTHSIDWKSLDAAGDHPQATIETSKGSFTVQLFPQMAPATVANFIDLVNLNYYAGKPFHRVVPGFVIQVGCNRGDGYGSLDYNIRSELPMVYYDQPGYLGMASAGNHTESAQWFVTQGSTPHLDGNYTLFGKVISGMETVNRMEVGDLIQKISIH